MGEPTTAPAAYAPRREVGTLDRVATVVLLLGLLVLVPVASLMGMLTAMASDSCTPSTCNDALLGAGVITSAASPVVAGFAALVWVVVRWSRGRPTWWVPLVALPAGAAGWLLGALVTTAAVG